MDFHHSGELQGRSDRRMNTVNVDNKLPKISTCFRYAAVFVSTPILFGLALHNMDNADVQNPLYCSYVPEKCTISSVTEELEAPEPITLQERAQQVFDGILSNDNTKAAVPTPVITINGVEQKRPALVMQ